MFKILEHLSFVHLSIFEHLRAEFKKQIMNFVPTCIKVHLQHTNTNVRVGSRISGMGVCRYKGIGDSLCWLYLILLNIT